MEIAASTGILSTKRGETIEASLTLMDCIIKYWANKKGRLILNKSIKCSHSK